MKLDKLYIEIIKELLKFNVDQLEEIKREWQEQIRVNGISEKIMSICMKLCDEVIMNKSEDTAHVRNAR